MLRKITLSALGFSLLAVTACNGAAHKLKLNKTITPTAGVSTQNKDVNTLINGKTCLPLFDLVAQLMSKNAQTRFTMYVQTRSLVDAGTLADDANLNFNLLIAPMTAITDTQFGSRLTSSALIGNLLSATAQSNCDQVIFPKAGLDVSGTSSGNSVAQDIFLVQKGVTPAAPVPTRLQNGQISSANPRPNAPPSLIMQSAALNETREYRINGDNLIIEVTKAAPGVKDCNGNMSPPMNVRTRYVMSLSGNDTGLSIEPRLGKNLVAFLVDVPSEIQDAVTRIQTISKANQAPKAKNANAAKPDSSRIPVGYGSLDILNTEFRSKLFKAVQCTK